jgi:hypothetical protein
MEASSDESRKISGRKENDEVFVAYGAKEFTPWR